jgi:hypothetical protein
MAETTHRTRATENYNPNRPTFESPISGTGISIPRRCLSLVQRDNKVDGRQFYRRAGEGFM